MENKSIKYILKFRKINLIPDPILNNIKKWGLCNE